MHLPRLDFKSWVVYVDGHSCKETSEVTWHEAKKDMDAAKEQLGTSAKAVEVSQESAKVSTTL